jgi:hypothetical protein
MDDQDQLPDESETLEDEEAQDATPESDPAATTSPLSRGRMAAAKPSGDRPVTKPEG